MPDKVNIINELLISVFNDMLKLEETALKNGVFSDISVIEVHTIEAIGMYVHSTMSQIAKTLKITVGTLTVAVNRLVKKGYVERFNHQQDRRVVLLGLTNKGRLMFRVHEKFHKDLLNEVIGKMNEDQTDALTGALVSLRDYLGRRG